MATGENVEVCLEVKKVGMNWRRIESKIDIKANLDTIWKVLTDYQRFPDFVPGISQTKIIHTKDNFVRLSQTGQEELPLGLKINAEMILDFNEKDFETSALGKKRVLEFKMVEGDFQILQGKWSVEQIDANGDDLSDDKQEIERRSSTSSSSSVVWYSAEFKPRMWVPFPAIEGRLCKNIKAHLSSIRQEAQRITMINAADPTPLPQIQ